MNLSRSQVVRPLFLVASKCSAHVSTVRTPSLQCHWPACKAARPLMLLPAGAGEAIPIPDSSVRALVAAQSFHWMSSALTLREVHRVLVPGGLFVLVWNTRDFTRPWVR